jgi:HEAT repeat protein
VSDRLEQNKARTTPKEALRKLRDPDPVVRLRAAKWLAKQALGETSNEVEAWIANAQAMSPIIAALDDQDPKVAEEAVIAVAEFTRRYFRHHRAPGGPVRPDPDDRAYPCVVRLFQAKSIQTRAWAIEATGWLRGARCINDILPMLQDKAARVRNSVLGVVWDAYEETRPDAATRERLLAAIRPLLKDKDGEVRSTAKSLRDRLRPEVTS